MTPEQTTLTAGLKPHFNDGHGKDGQSKEAASQILSVQDKTLKKAFLIFFFYLFMSLLPIWLYSFIQKDILIYVWFRFKAGQDTSFLLYPVSLLTAINIVPFTIPALGAAISYKILGKIQSGVLFVCFFIAIALSLVGFQKLGLSSSIVFSFSYAAFLITVSCFVGWCSKQVFDRGDTTPVLLIANRWGCFSVFSYFTIIGFVVSVILDSGFVSLVRFPGEHDYYPSIEFKFYVFFSYIRYMPPLYYGWKLGMFAFFALIITLICRYRSKGLSIRAISKIIFIPAFILVFIKSFMLYRALGMSLSEIPFTFAMVVNDYIFPACFLTLSAVYTFWLVANWYNRTSAQKTQG